MRRANAHVNRASSNGNHRIDATVLVFCDVNAVGQAVTRSLHLTSFCQIPLERAAAGPSRWPWSGRQPDLAIVIDSDASTLVSAVRAIKRRWTQIRVLVMGLQQAQAAILSCVEAGADGLFMADEPLEELPAAVLQILAGRFRPPKNLLRIWANETRPVIGASRSAGDPGAGRVFSLSAREPKTPVQSAKVAPDWAGGLTTTGKSVGRKLDDRTR
jgi:DNA-binding NarL/FixJ family response regulator